MYRSLLLFAILASSTTLVIGGSVYFIRYIDHQKTVISELDSRIKALEEKVFPPKKAVEPTETKKSSRKQPKKSS